MLPTLGNNKTPNFSFVFSFFLPPPCPPSVTINQPRSAEPAEKRHEAPAARVGQRRRDALGVKVLAALASCQPPPPRKEHNIRFRLCQEQRGKKTKQKRMAERKKEKKKKVKEREKNQKKRKKIGKKK